MTTESKLTACLTDFNNGMAIVDIAAKHEIPYQHVYRHIKSQREDVYPVEEKGFKHLTFKTAYFAGEHAAYIKQLEQDSWNRLPAIIEKLKDL